MSLVERSVEGTPEERVARRKRRTPTGDANAASALKPKKLFELNFQRLADQGFFTPNCRQHRLALELRAVKRRLLRRLKYYRNERQEKRASQTEALRNTVLMTSTCPGEGKTFTSINLALSLAIEDNIDVLLVDADVPRPRVLHHLGLQQTQGLTDKIMDPDIPVSNLVVKEINYPFSLLSEGNQRGPGLEMVARPEMGKLLRDISKQYPRHIILVDAPPVLATPEASLIARYVDEVVFVVRASDTKEPAVVTALDEVLDNNQNVSLVLNNCLVPERASQYGSYGEYYEKMPDGRK